MKYQRIDELEDEFEEVVLHNRGARRIDNFLEYASLLNGKVNNGIISERSVSFLRYIERYGEQTGSGRRIYADDLVRLFERDYATRRHAIQSFGDREVYGPFQNRIYFIAFYLLVYIKIDESETFDVLTRDLEKYEKGFEDKSLYQYIKSHVYQRGFTADHYREAIESASKSLSDDSNNPYFFSAFAGSVAKLYYSDTQTEVDIDGLPSDKEELLKLADGYARKATTLPPNHPQFHATSAEIFKLQEDYEAAEKEINKAIQIATEDETTKDYLISSYRRSLRDLRQDRRHAKQAEVALTKARKEIQNLEDRREKLENQMEEYRNQTLQFIGFFAGIIAIVVTSAQMLSNLNTVAQASRVVLVLTGGLIISFSALGSIFVSPNKNWSRIVITTISGILLVLLGIFTPQIVNLVPN